MTIGKITASQQDTVFVEVRPEDGTFMETHNGTTRSNYYMIDSVGEQFSAAHWFGRIKVKIGNVVHVIFNPLPAGNYYLEIKKVSGSCGISVVTDRTLHNANNTVDMATLQVTYYLWVDASGFVIMAKPEPSGNNEQGSFLAVVERNPNKEYTDGFSNFFCYNACNYMNGTNTADYYMTPYIRPFTYQNRDYNQEGMPTINVNGIYFPACPWTSFKSVGNGKVYYIKPIYFNTADRRTPIAQSKMFFAYAETVGLILCDVEAQQERNMQMLEM